MPFLVVSVNAELNRRALAVQQLINPVLCLTRDAGKIVHCAHRAKAGGDESFMHIHVEECASTAERAEIAASITSILADVRASLED